MGLPAARITDMTAHGGMITLGSPTTLIGGMPASRIGDLHTCPMVTVAVPHVGGPIVLGAFNVLVGGPPQARLTDMCTCVGPPSLVVLGSFTTLVGMEGAFAGAIGGALSAVTGALLAGLDGAAAGFPAAVADAAQSSGYSTRYSEGVVIEGTPEFQAGTLSALETIASTESGAKVLDRISESGRTTTIRETSGDNETEADG